MNRVVFVVNTVMTLMSSVYYAIEIKRDNPKTEIALIWQNPTPHRIPLKKFDMYFDRVYEISKGIPVWGILSIESIGNDWICNKHLRASGIYQYLSRKYNRDILMVSADYNGTMGNVINIYHKKRTSKKIILFEEGMALYSDKKRTWKEVIDYNLGKTVDMQPVIGASNKIDTIFAQHPAQLPDWKRKNKKIVKQSDVFADTGIWSDILNKDTYFNKLSSDLQGKKVLLYLGQPIHEFSKQFRPKQEMDLLYRVSDKMPQDYVMLIKAHPRDPVSKYSKLQDRENCIVFDRRVGWYPIECLLSLFETKMVMTFSSSAALNILDRVDDCSAVYTYKFFGISVAGNWKQMYSVYGDRVQIPASPKEMDELTFEAHRGIETEKKRSRSDDLKYITRYLKNNRK